MVNLVLNFTHIKQPPSIYFDLGAGGRGSLQLKQIHPWKQTISRKTFFNHPNPEIFVLFVHVNLALFQTRTD